MFGEHSRNVSDKLFTRKQLPKLLIPTTRAVLSSLPAPPPTPAPENSNKKFDFSVSATNMQQPEESSGAVRERDCLIVRRLNKTALLPVRQTVGSIGYDLFASESKTVPPRGRVLVDIGISIRLPRGTYGRIAPRSGLAVFHGICVGAGVIDPDYCGRLSVLLFNHGVHEFQLHRGARIAQLILERALIATVKDETDSHPLGTKAVDHPPGEAAGTLAGATSESNEPPTPSREEEGGEVFTLRHDSGFGSSGIY